MSILKKYDFIIIGSGCAGLSLAYRMIKKEYKVCILESQKNLLEKNKLWSFWDTYKNPFSHLSEKKWDKMIVKKNNKYIEIDCENYKYQSIDSHKFTNFILEKINTCNNIEIQYNSEVVDLKYHSNKVLVYTKDNNYECNHVFDSRPIKKNIKMWQQFFGVYIHSDEDVFDENKPILMDFLDTKNKFHFMYVLPFSSKYALFESTYFSSEIEKKYLDEKYIKDFLKENYNLSNINIEKTEAGRIPMDTLISSSCNSYITKIGSYSGATRASTGYTFINIQKQTDKIFSSIDEIYKGKYKGKKYFHSFVLRKMDEIFLRLIEDNPEYMKNALYSLFDKKSHKSQIKFLSDIPNILDIIKIIIYLPKTKFLQYFFKPNNKNDK